MVISRTGGFFMDAQQSGELGRAARSVLANVATGLVRERIPMRPVAGRIPSTLNHPVGERIVSRPADLVPGGRGHGVHGMSRSSVALSNLRAFVILLVVAFHSFLAYLFVVWLQYILLGVALFAIAKAAIVFGATVMLSWVTAVALCRVPIGGRVVGADRRVLVRTLARE